MGFAGRKKRQGKSLPVPNTTTTDQATSRSSSPSSAFWKAALSSSSTTKSSTPVRAAVDGTATRTGASTNHQKRNLKQVAPLPSPQPPNNLHPRPSRHSPRPATTMTALPSLPTAIDNSNPKDDNNDKKKQKNEKPSNHAAVPPDGLVLLVSSSSSASSSSLLSPSPQRRNHMVAPDAAAAAPESPSSPPPHSNNLIFSATDLAAFEDEDEQQAVDWWEVDDTSTLASSVMEHQTTAKTPLVLKASAHPCISTPQPPPPPPSSSVVDQPDATPVLRNPPRSRSRSNTVAKQQQTTPQPPPRVSVIGSPQDFLPQRNRPGRRPATEGRPQRPMTSSASLWETGHRRPQSQSIQRGGGRPSSTRSARTTLSRTTGRRHDLPGNYYVSSPAAKSSSSSVFDRLYQDAQIRRQRHATRQQQQQQDERQQRRSSRRWRHEPQGDHSVVSSLPSASMRMSPSVSSSRGVRPSSRNQHAQPQPSLPTPSSPEDRRRRREAAHLFFFGGPTASWDATEGSVGVDSAYSSRFDKLYANEYETSASKYQPQHDAASQSVASGQESALSRRVNYRPSPIQQHHPIPLRPHRTTTTSEAMISSSTIPQKSSNSTLPQAAAAPPWCSPSAASTSRAAAVGPTVPGRGGEFISHQHPGTTTDNGSTKMKREEELTVVAARAIQRWWRRQDQCRRRVTEQPVSSPPMDEFAKWKQLQTDWFRHVVVSEDPEETMDELLPQHPTSPNAALSTDRQPPQQALLESPPTPPQQQPPLHVDTLRFTMATTTTTTPTQSPAVAKLAARLSSSGGSGGSSKRKVHTVDSSRELQWQELQRGWSSLSATASSSRSEPCDGRHDQRTANKGLPIQQQEENHRQEENRTEGVPSHKMDEKERPLEITAVIRLQSWWRSKHEVERYQGRLVALQRLQVWWRHCLPWRLSAIRVQSWWRRVRNERQFQGHCAAIMCLQAWWRTVRQRSLYQGLRVAVVCLQAFVRCRLQVQRYKRHGHAAQNVQQWYRHIQEETRRKNEAGQRLQAWWRRTKELELSRGRDIASTRVQAWFRGLWWKRQYQGKRRAVVQIQAWWRRRVQEFRDYQRMNSAVTRIQRWYQCVCSQQRYRGFRQAVILVQTWWRHVSLDRRQRRMNVAATTVQSWFRRARSQQRYQGQRLAVLRLQTWYRQRHAVRHGQRMDVAAVVLQSSYRGIHFYRRYQRKRRAVLQLQGWWRCLRTMARELLQKCDEAATVVQSRYRGGRAYQSYHKHRLTVLFLQSWWRGACVLRQQRRMDTAVVVVQTWYRQVYAHRKYQQQRLAVRRIQFWCRHLVSARQKRRMASTALVVQTWYRQASVYRKYQAHHHAVLVAQNWWRHIHQQRLKCSSTVLQSWYRRIRSERRYRGLLLAVLRLQSWCRAMIIAQQKKRRDVAATTLQLWYRGVHVRQVYQGKRLAILKLQSWGRRMCDAHRKEEEQQRRSSSICVIQSWYRQIQCCRSYKEKRQAVVRIQALYRQLNEMRLYRKMIFASVTIQNWWRAFRISVARRTHATQRIQTWWRHSVEIMKKERKRLACVLVISTQWRQYRAQRQFQRMHVATVMLQGWWRCVHLSARFKSFVRAIKLVQFWWRAQILRKTQLQACAAANCIQRQWLRTIRRRHKVQVAAIRLVQRTWRRKRKDQALFASATRVQTWWRRAQHVSRFSRTRALVIALQSFWRMYTQRQTYRDMLLSALAVQSWWRMELRKSLSRQIAARRIQVCWRFYDAEIKHERLHYTSMVRIQSLVRKKIAMRHLQRSRAAATFIQRRWRKLLRLLQIMRLHSIIRIQSLWRKETCRHFYQKQRSAAICLKDWLRFRYQHRLRRQPSTLLLQSWWRRLSAKHAYEKAQSAAISIQSWWRQVLAMLEAHSRRKTFRSAILIQNCWRSFQSVMAQRQAAAILISASWRRVQARRLVRQAIHACVKLQSWWRCMTAAASFRTIQVAVLLLQSRVRMRYAARKFQLCRTSATLIQYSWRTALSIQQLRRCIGYVRTIQSAWRGHFAVVEYMKMRHNRAVCITRIQCLFRVFMAKKRFVEHRSAIIRIQRRWRRFRSLVQLDAATRIQSHVRSLQCREDMRTRHDASRVIQRWTTAYLRSHQKNRLEQDDQNRRLQRQLISGFGTATYQWERTLELCITLQAAVRCFLARKSFLAVLAGMAQRTMRAGTVLCLSQYELRHQAADFVPAQALWRQYRLRRRYLNTLQAILLIQRRWRLHLMTETVAVGETALIVLQSLARSKRCRTEFQTQKRATRTIQNCWHRFQRTMQNVPSTSSMKQCEESDDLKSAENGLVNPTNLTHVAMTHSEASNGVSLVDDLVDNTPDMASSNTLHFTKDLEMDRSTESEALSRHVDPSTAAPLSYGSRESSFQKHDSELEQSELSVSAHRALLGHSEQRELNHDLAARRICRVYIVWKIKILLVQLQCALVLLKRGILGNVSKYTTMALILVNAFVRGSAIMKRIRTAPSHIMPMSTCQKILAIWDSGVAELKAFAATVIQTMVRSSRAVKKQRNLATVLLQCWVRSWLALRQTTIMIQARHVARMEQKTSCAVKIQTNWRGFTVRKLALVEAPDGEHESFFSASSSPDVVDKSCSTVLDGSEQKMADGGEATVLLAETAHSCDTTSPEYQKGVEMLQDFFEHAQKAQEEERRERERVTAWFLQRLEVLAEQTTQHLLQQQQQARPETGDRTYCQSVHRLAARARSVTQQVQRIRQQQEQQPLHNTSS